MNNEVHMDTYCSIVCSCRAAADADVQQCGLRLTQLLREIGILQLAADTCEIAAILLSIACMPAAADSVRCTALDSNVPPTCGAARRQHVISNSPH